MKTKISKSYLNAIASACFVCRLLMWEMRIKGPHTLSIIVQILIVSRPEIENIKTVLWILYIITASCLSLLFSKVSQLCSSNKILERVS